MKYFMYFKPTSFVTLSVTKLCNQGDFRLEFWEDFFIFQGFCFTSCYFRIAAKDHDPISTPPESAGLSLMFLMSCSLVDHITFPMKAKGLSFSTASRSPLHEQTTLPAILPTVKNSCLYHIESQ